jgi:hypothetical protein
MRINVRKEIILADDPGNVAVKFYTDPSDLERVMYSKWDVQEELQEKFGRKEMWKNYHWIDEKFEKIDFILEDKPVPEDWVDITYLVRVGAYIEREEGDEE